ncbi:MAG: RNA polymerase sigma factor [Opitutaceae bacterium]
MNQPASQPLSSAPPCEVPTAARSQWFHDEVHPHDLRLKSYLRGSFPSVRDVDDVIQESYLRIWKARLAGPIASTKSFLFHVARNLAIDTIRRRQTARTDSLGDMAELPVMEDKRDAADQLCYEEKVELLAAAFLHLPPRCREIMTLRKLKGVPNQEIADRMGISVLTVENQITRGIHLCRAYLQERGLHGFNRE